MRSGLHLLAIAWVATACGRRDGPTPSRSARASAAAVTTGAPPIGSIPAARDTAADAAARAAEAEEFRLRWKLAPDTVLVRQRADWEPFIAKLPTDPAAAAAALEDYRRRHGLAFDYLIHDDMPDSLRRALGVRSDADEMGCGAAVTMHVQRLAVLHPFVYPEWVVELDSTDRVIHRWPVPDEFATSGGRQAVAGLEGNELVVRLDWRPGLYLRLAEDGSYRVSTEAPPALAAQEWIALEDSTFVRVRPADHMSFHSGRTRGVDPGRWVPMSDSGWYRRVDDGPHRGDSARSVRIPWDPTPENLACPRTSAYDGMYCQGFPDGGRTRRIALGIPCT